MSDRKLVPAACLKLYRRRLLAASGLCLGGLLVPAALHAQTDDGRGVGGDLTDPAQILPGPWGPFGGPGGDIGGGDDDGSKEDLEDASEATGDVGDTLDTIGRGMAGVGGAVAGVGAATGIGAGIGGVISIIGIVTMGIGAIFNTISNTLGELADDPPRSNFQQDPACAALPRPQFGGGATAPQALTAHADAAAAFLAEAASCLAALELWGGARQAGNGQWMIRHRANFVTRFNAMAQRGAAAAGTGPAAVAAIQGALSDAGLTMGAVRDHFQANAPAIRAWAQPRESALLNQLAGQCAEIGHAARLRGNRGNRIAPDQLAGRYQALQQRMRGLPSYS